MDGLFDEDLGDGHEVLCQGTGFIGADVVSATHSFTGLEISDQVVFFFHLSDGIGQGNSDGEWKSFRDSDNDDTDGNDKEFDDLVNCFDRDEALNEAFFHEAVINVMQEHSGEGGGG